jgi:pyruvate dehydrogenase E2 component (dihydrolipoamide acetyltransferase)
MAIDFKLPDLGENVESGDVVTILVHEGDTIEANQNVLELETDKAMVEIQCPHAGRITKIHVQPGQTVPIGTLLLTVEAGAPAAKSDGAAPAPEKPAKKADAPKPEPEQVAALASKPAAPAKPKSAPAPQPVAEEDDEDDDDHEPAPAPNRNGGHEAEHPVAEGAAVTSPAGPSTRRLARELGVDLRRVTGTGPGGRITRNDVVAAVRHSSSVLKASPTRGNLPDGVADQDNYGNVRYQALSKIRKTIASNMARSSQTIPHVTNFDDADITELERIRKDSSADYAKSDLKLTMMAFVVKAVSQSLKLHPTLNASLDLENNRVIYKQYVNLGIAVDTERGLVVPVIRDVDQLTIPQVAQALTDVANKGRASQFTIDDLRGGSFTISNLGAVGGTYSTPIINYPEVAVLLTGRSRMMPIIVGDKIEPRLMMPLSLSYDHRLVDGAVAARFLNEVKNFLQVPGRLLLAT